MQTFMLYVMVHFFQRFNEYIEHNMRDTVRGQVTHRFIDTCFLKNTLFALP